MPFGEEVNPQITTNHYKFTGDEHDAEDNTEHTQFRQLSTVQGRWLSPDPAGMAAADLTNPQTLNLYAYVGNNPMNGFDPLGLYDAACEDPDFGPFHPLACPLMPGGPGVGPAHTCDFYDEGTDPCPFPQFPITVGIGGGGAGGGKSSGTPSPEPHVNYNGALQGETLGIPNTVHIYIPSILQTLGLAPNDPACDFVACGFQTTPVHGIWHYGNWCGPGGMGTPTNDIDRACMLHDLSFNKIGADWTNMQSETNWKKLSADQQKQVQIADQQLCDAMARIIPKIPLWNVSQTTAAHEINDFFHSHVPKGARCK